MSDCEGKVGGIGDFFGCNGFLILLLLFILLASNCTCGREKNFFFIIILAIIAFGGVGRTFGFGGAAVGDGAVVGGNPGIGGLFGGLFQ